MADETKSPELEAVELVTKQVEGFKTILGSKADKGEFDSLKGTIEDLKKSIADNDGKATSEKIKTINDATEKLVKQVSTAKSTKVFLRLSITQAH